MKVEVDVWVEELGRWPTLFQIVLITVEVVMTTLLC